MIRHGHPFGFYRPLKFRDCKRFQSVERSMIMRREFGS